MGTHPPPSQCDIAFGYTAAGVTELDSTGGNTGYRPAVNKWHHVVVTYTGSGAQAGGQTEKVWVDGYLASSYTGRVLNIDSTTDPRIRLGSWWDTGANGYAMYGSFALNTLRIHDGALPDAAVAFNFAAEAPRFIPTQTPTKTGTASRTATASVSATSSLSGTPSNSGSTTATASGTPPNTATPSSTQLGTNSITGSTSLSASITPSTSLSASVSATGSSTALPTTSSSPTATQSSPVRVARSLLIDLHAEDYDPATANWMNRAGTGLAQGPFNINGGDFGANGNPQNSWPSKQVVGYPGSLAVWFDHNAFNGPQHLESGNAFYPQSSIYGASDWSMEAWCVRMTRRANECGVWRAPAAAAAAAAYCVMLRDAGVCFPWCYQRVCVRVLCVSVTALGGGARDHHSV